MENPKASWKQLTKLVLFAALSSVLVIFLAGPFIKAIRTYFGPKIFWTLGALFALTLAVLGQGFSGLVLLAAWLMIGLYNQLNQRFSLLAAATISTLFSSALVILIPVQWAKNQGIVLKDEILESIAVLLGTLDPQLAVSIKPRLPELYSQIPSMVMLGMMLILIAAIMLEKSAAKLVGLSEVKSETDMKVLEFRMPDIAIWLLMGSLCLSFWKIGNEDLVVLGRNGMNILLGAYFIQGLAVLESTLLAFKVSSLFKAVFYFLIVGQLFFLLSPVGIIDYWVDFRKRISSIRSPQKRPNNEEHL